MYEIRIFYEKLNGETGHLMHRYKAKTSNELLKKWFIHLSDFEGWPYEIYDFDKDEIITDWVYDPDDYIIIGDYFGITEKEIENADYYIPYSKTVEAR